MSSAPRHLAAVGGQAPQLLDFDQVAERMNVCRSTVVRLHAAGEIEAINVGSAARPRYRVTEDALLAFYASRAV
jgi:excisionase family DNA binding protein